MRKPEPKNWESILLGTPSHPRLMDFSQLRAQDVESFCAALEARSQAVLAKVKTGKIDPDLLAYEECHRAWSNWKYQIDESMGLAPRYQRLAGKANVTHLKKWTIALLQARIPPGDYLRIVTPVITGSPTFKPSIGFSFPYLFCEALRSKVELLYAEKGRVFSAREAGIDKKNSFVGQLDTRVIDYLRTVEGFDSARWNSSNVHIIVSVAKQLAARRNPYMTNAIRLLAVPLSKQDWLSTL